MNKKGKSTIKNHLTSIINKKSINQHFHEQKGLIDYKTIQQIHSLNISNLSRDNIYKTHSQNRCDNSTTMSQQKTIKKKKIQDEYNRLLEMVNRYEHYYKKILQHQKDNYIKYCMQIIQMIKCQFQKGKEQLQQKMKSMSTVFKSHRDKIFYVLKEIQHNQHYDQLFDSKFNQFKILEYIEVQFIEVVPVNIQHLQREFQRYQAQFYQSNVREKYQLQRSYNHHHHQNKENQHHQIQIGRHVPVELKGREQSTQTQSFEECKQRYKEKQNLNQRVKEEIDDDEFDNFLGCDEEIGQQISESVKKRRKYQVKRHNIIKQQDEFQENNSVISEN